DSETALYYFGARYLDPRTSRWISSDPALEDYVPQQGQGTENLPGNGGIFNPINLNQYHYAGDNLVKFTDPTGEDTIYFGINATLTNPVITARNIVKGLVNISRGEPFNKGAIPDTSSASLGLYIDTDKKEIGGYNTLEGSSGVPSIGLAVEAGYSPLDSDTVLKEGSSEVSTVVMPGQIGVEQAAVFSPDNKKIADEIKVGFTPLKIPTPKGDYDAGVANTDKLTFFSWGSNEDE
ncbi:MAG: hypothetical protein KAR21_04255, partial [Spirochaetales bacterium]|nr:hypothetical protein [Spirochaetales bacterium]